MVAPATGENVADQTANKQAGDRGTCETGKDGECLRETDLNSMVCETECIGKKCENDIKSSYHSRLSKNVDFFVFHCFLLSFVFSP